MSEFIRNTLTGALMFSSLTSPALAKEIRIKCDLTGSVALISGGAVRHLGQQTKNSRIYILNDEVKTISLFADGKREPICVAECKLTYTNVLITKSDNDLGRGYMQIDRQEGTFLQTHYMMRENGVAIHMEFSGPCKAIVAADSKF